MTDAIAAAPVAFLGLGVMGGPMTANLARGGVPVRAWNRTPDRPGAHLAAEAGAALCETLADAVAPAAIVFTCLGDVPDVEAVLLGPGGVAACARPGTLVVDTSTIGPDAARTIGDRLAERGLRFVDAPISGGDIAAQRGTLTIMAGGAPEDFAAAEPYFALMGKTLRHCGPVGSGQAVKLCNQILAAVHMTALCEAMELARSQGIDPNLVVEVCSTGAAGSWALANLGPKVIAEDCAPGFAIAHMLKDLRLVREAADRAGLALPGTDLADRHFQIVGEFDGGAGRQQGTQAAYRVYRQGRARPGTDSDGGVK